MTRAKLFTALSLAAALAVWTGLPSPSMAARQDYVGTSDRWVAVTPSDSTTFSPAPRAVYVGAAGNLSMIASGDATDTAVLFVAVAAGTLLPVSPKVIRETGTTAQSIVAIY